MRRLMEQSGETVNLGIADRGEIVYLAQVECHKMMRAIAGPGGRARMHCSGVGKAILCNHDEDTVRKVLHGREMTRETSHTHTSIETLFEDLDLCRQRGYAIDDEENAIGLRCVASSVFDEHGDPLWRNLGVRSLGPHVPTSGFRCWVTWSTASLATSPLNWAVYRAAARASCR
jgi:IclR family acetate operon transcriptional repressor